MLNSATQAALTTKYGAPAGTAFNDLSVAMGIVNGTPLSAENFMVKFMTILAGAEMALPPLQKQNNFGYSIGEGGAFRATIKATVTLDINVLA